MTPASNAIDARSIHRTLTGLRDRLRLQEDEIDRLRETMQAFERQLAEQGKMVQEVSRRPQAVSPGTELAAPRFRWRIPLITAAVLIGSLVAVWYFFFRDAPRVATAPAASSTSTLIDLARAYEADRNYPKAEEVYRELLAKDPGNIEAIRHLATVLYQEDRVDESDAVSRRLSSGSTSSLPAPH